MNRKTLFIALLVLTPVLFACQKMVEKEHMDAMGQWSTSMCQCAEKDSAEAKACADALQEPRLETVNSSGRPIYKLNSLHAYDDIEAIGMECKMKVMQK